MALHSNEATMAQALALVLVLPGRPDPGDFCDAEENAPKGRQDHRRKIPAKRNLPLLLQKAGEDPNKNQFAGAQHGKGFVAQEVGPGGECDDQKDEDSGRSSPSQLLPERECWASWAWDRRRHS